MKLLSTVITYDKPSGSTQMLTDKWAVICDFMENMKICRFRWLSAGANIELYGLVTRVFVCFDNCSEHITCEDRTREREKEEWQWEKWIKFKRNWFFYLPFRGRNLNLMIFYNGYTFLAPNNISEKMNQIQWYKGTTLTFICH